MDPPDMRLFDADVDAADFRDGVLARRWGFPDEGILPAQPDWPARILWLAASPRDGSPDRFYLSLDLAGYRARSPTGTFWDPIAKSLLDVRKRPKGREGSRFARVFRTDWEQGRAFYHPYDRVAMQGHSKWGVQHPNLIWTAKHTIVDYLWEFHLLLNSGDYRGV